MHDKADVIDRSRRKLEGIIQVLEVLEAPLLEHSYSHTLSELQQLMEFIRKVVQHAEVMAWCARHQFLESLSPRFTSVGQWLTAVEERRSAARKRAWTEGLQTTVQFESGHEGSMFIEDALANLGMGRDGAGEAGNNEDFLEPGWLQETGLVQTSPSLKYMQDAVSGQSGVLYPPKSVRAAVDKLFLEGSSDLILAKKAIVSLTSVLW
jgi:E3 ubiquitin-protein ligase HOS1